MFLEATYAWSLLWIYFSCFLCIILYYSDIQESQDSFRIYLFWKKSKGLFDDGNTYLGVIVRKDPETNM